MLLVPIRKVHINNNELIKSTMQKDGLNELVFLPLKITDILQKYYRKLE